MQKKEKIIKAIKNHNLFLSIVHKIVIKSDIARVKEKQQRLYNKLYKKYKKLIQNDNNKIIKENESNYVWICWFQGIENAPDLVKACVNSIKENMPNKEIVIITSENLNDYVEIPEYIMKKFKNKIISFAHFSDLIRTELLCKYGGLWIDSTVLCTSDKILKILDDKELFVFKELDLTKLNNQATVASSWFIYSKYKNDPILLLTRKLLYQYWKDYNVLKEYFLFHLFFAMSCRKYNEEWSSIPTYNNHSPHILMFDLNKEYNKKRWDEILDMTPIHKLQRHNNYSNIENSIYNHILKTYLKESVDNETKSSK